MKKRNILFAFLLLTVVGMLLASCRKDDEIDTNPSIKLAFSADTVLFDTVFTTIGTVTQTLTVYNNHDKAVNISRIYLAGGSKSEYQINIDGSPVSSINDVEIRAEDSLFIFVKATIDPTQQNAPLIRQDSIIFETNGNEQDVDLVAWGQDAHYYTPTNHPQNFPDYSTISENTVWENDKPYVIYGWLVVDSLATLHIKEGCRVHFHNSSVLMVYRDGSLIVDGKADSLVHFSGDRLESFYDELPGQWGGIWFSEGSKNNYINHAEIKNGVLGLQVDFFNPNSQNPTLILKNTIVKNMSVGAIGASATVITSENCVFAACNEYAVSLNGGIYNFKQTTIGNYAGHDGASFLFSDYFSTSDGNIKVEPSELYMGNSIVYGTDATEVFTYMHPESTELDFQFDHCLLRTEAEIPATHLTECIINEDPLFVDYTLGNYQLDSLSPARNKGIPMGVNLDILGNTRPDTPDLGAYETQYDDDSY